MRSFHKTHTIIEYCSFSRAVEIPGYQTLPGRTFDALEAFILANNARNKPDVVDLLSLSVHRNAGKIITARNYVGLISMVDGTTIEILPKIVGSAVTEKVARDIFLEMLKSLNDITYKEFNTSRLHTDRLNLMEIFIRMFLDEVNVLAKQGLRSTYTPHHANEFYLKGKLITSKHIKHNIVNKARFFICYDDFNINRPENRLIKATLRLLRRITNDEHNHQNIARLLTVFESVEDSTDISADFSKCVRDRSMSCYQRALSWSRVFLRGNSFTAFAGSDVAIALLFPMEKVFESFVAAKFRNHAGNDNTLRIQDRKHSLYDSPKPAFFLRPDIVMESNGKTFVFDTKWKLLSENERNYGISQSDMYQMYAYGKKYAAEKVLLLFPQSFAAKTQDISYVSNDGVNMEVCLIDLQHADASVSDIVTGIFGTHKQNGTC